MVIFNIFKKIKRFRKLLARRIFTFIVVNKAAKIGGKIVVNHRSSVSSSTELGNNVHFNGMTISGKGRVIIGNNFHSGKRCQIMSDYHNFDTGQKIPYDDTFIIQDVVIGDNVWFGNNVIVLPGVCIGEGAIIQAGSVVVSDIPACALAGGHPARVFKYRDIDHYEKLKNEEKFH